MHALARRAQAVAGAKRLVGLGRPGPAVAALEAVAENQLRLEGGSCRATLLAVAPAIGRVKLIPRAQIHFL
jgi:hypothetical protein